MVSGFFTSPCDHSRIFSGLASEMRIARERERVLGLLEEAEDVTHGDLRLHCLRGRADVRDRVIRSSSAADASAASTSMSSTFRHSDWSSLMSTLKLSGRPGFERVVALDDRLVHARAAHARRRT